ncbi:MULTISPECIES: zinc-binding alcohol dehydrogenase family protein [Falsihalocynthiibacter]|uniref:zinc-binding alcohol dehydrogenase family protein n=1 Tax=Falsihalocynthiibacter TaxID=2854182 RepID=UPI003002B95C
MRALVIEKIGQAGFREIDAPQPKADEVLIDVKHVGLCGSDLNTFRGTNPLSKLPRIPGHEIGGVIRSAGSEVPIEFSNGASVIVIPYSTCGKCSSCLNGRENACKYNETLGVQKDGGMSTSIVVHHDRLIRNDQLIPAHLALVEPLSVGFHAVARGRVSEKDTVVVLGGGMIGVGAMLGAKARGARVIAVEVSEEKHAPLLKLGVDYVINPTKEDLEKTLATLTNGNGADVVVEAVGLPETFRAAIDLVCFSGRVVYVGYAKSEVSYNTSLFNLKELDILGSRNATRTDFDAVIAFISGQEELASSLISRVFAWAEADLAFEYWEANRNKTFKVMIDLEEG